MPNESHMLVSKIYIVYSDISLHYCKANAKVGKAMKSLHHRNSDLVSMTMFTLSKTEDKMTVKYFI